VTREASAARREIGRETPPSVVFYEMSVTFFRKMSVGNAFFHYSGGNSAGNDAEIPEAVFAFTAGKQ